MILLLSLNCDHYSSSFWFFDVYYWQSSLWNIEFILKVKHFAMYSSGATISPVCPTWHTHKLFLDFKSRYSGRKDTKTSFWSFTYVDNLYDQMRKPILLLCRETLRGHIIYNFQNKKLSHMASHVVYLFLVEFKFII